MFDTLFEKPTADCGQPRRTRRNAMHSLDIHRPSHIAEMLRFFLPPRRVGPAQRERPGFFWRITSPKCDDRAYSTRFGRTRRTSQACRCWLLADGCWQIVFHCTATAQNNRRIRLRLHPFVASSLFRFFAFSGTRSHSAEMLRFRVSNISSGSAFHDRAGADRISSTAWPLNQNMITM